MSDPKKQDSAADRKEPLDLESAIRKHVLARDSRYALGAYLFIYESLAYTQKHLGRDDADLDPGRRHVSGGELLDGIRAYAAELFGPLAPTVFRSWGLRRTEDFGEIVFNLVDKKLLGKTDKDHRDDFAQGFDFDTAFEGTLDTNLQ